MYRESSSKNIKLSSDSACSCDTDNSASLVNKAFKQSFGLMDDISDKMWTLFQTKYKQSSLYANPKNPLKGVENEKQWLKVNLIPNFNCPHVERVGSGEGRKFICYPHRVVRKERNDECLVYSIGCAGDFYFEDAISAKYGNKCEVHVFDPANWEREGDAKNRNIHYHAWGLQSTYDNVSKSVVWPKGRGGTFKTFQETIEILGHKDRVIDLFKIDCEGCEWSTYKDWIGIGFRQILMEIHGVPQPNGGKGRWYQSAMDASKFFQDFQDNGYVLFNKDPNNDLAVELSFLKLDKDFHDPAKTE